MPDTVFIDFGCSRTALAFADADGWMNFPAIDKPGQNRARGTTLWTAPGDLVDEATAWTRVDDKVTPVWAWLHSRYHELPGGLIVPSSVPPQSEDDVRYYPWTTTPRPGDPVRLKQSLPPGATLGGAGAPAKRFLDCILTTVLGDGPMPSLVFGRSLGAMDPRDAGFATARVYHEAVAVLHGVLAAEPEKASRTSLVIADLGGGFLDVCAVTGVHRQEDGNIGFELVNEGSYPIGIDLASGREFSVAAMGEPKSYVRIIGAVVALHASRLQAVDVAPPGILLTGGGFRRLQDPASSIAAQLRSLQPAKHALSSPDVKAIRGDTKRLTLSGLRRLHGTYGLADPPMGHDVSLDSPARDAWLLDHLRDTLGHAGVVEEQTWRETIRSVTSAFVKQGWR